VVSARVRLTYKAAGISFDTSLTTVEYEQQKIRTFKLEGMITGANHWELTPEGDGTRVKMTLDYEMPCGGLGKIADRLFVQRTNEKNAENSLGILRSSWKMSKIKTECSDDERKHFSYWGIGIN
jgi:uncharacterized membrane protein